jgi:hypothetical protein
VVWTAKHENECSAEQAPSRERFYSGQVILFFIASLVYAISIPSHQLHYCFLLRTTDFLTAGVGYYTHGETAGTEEPTGELVVHLAADSCLKMMLEWKLSMTVSIASD